MAYKFTIGTFKLGGTIDMSSATDVVHKDGTVDNDDLAGSINQDKLAGGITAVKLALGEGLENDGSGNTRLKRDGNDSGLDLGAGGAKVKIDGNTLNRANNGISVNVGNVTAGLANQNRNINSGAGLSGGGNLTSDRTLSIDLAGSNPGLDFDGSGDTRTLKLKSTIGGNRTFSNDVTVNGHLNCDSGNVNLFAGVGTGNTITVGAADATVAIAGNLSVAGTTTTVNSTDLLVADKVIQIAKNANDQTTSKDSGIQFGQGNANGARWLYEINGANEQVFVAKQGSGTQKIRIEAAEFLGPATQASVLNENGNSTNRILFAANAGSQDFRSNNQLTYNPGLNGGTLEAGRFKGDGRELTNLPPAAFPIFNKNAAGSAVSLGNEGPGNYILGNGGQGNGTHIFRITGSAGGLGFANGDELRIKAPDDADGNRKYRISGSGVVRFDGASSFDLDSANAAVTLIFVGNHDFKIF